MSRQYNSVFLFVALAAVAALIGVQPCAAEWTVTDLGVLDGFAYSRAVAVNASGQVVGDSFNGSPGEFYSTTSSQAFVWESGTGLVSLPLLDGFANSFAVDINASGQIVGTCWNDSYCCDCNSEACLWEYDTNSSTWEVTGLLDSALHLGSTALDINDAGQVLLHSIGATDPEAPPAYGRGCGGTLWENGTLTDLTTADGYPIWPNAMNASGQVTGQPCCDTRPAVVWAAGTTTVLTPDADRGEGYAINAQGEVVGYLQSAGQFFHFLWLPADAYDLAAGLYSSLKDNLECCNITSAINDAGLVLRHSTSYAGNRYWSPLAVVDLATGEPVAAATVPRTQSFNVNFPGVMNASGELVGGCEAPDTEGTYAGYYLSADTGHAYLPSLSGSGLDGYSWAMAIDDAGHIVGFSSPSEGEVHAALWTGTAPTNEAPVLGSLTTPLSGVVGLPVTFTAAATDANVGDSDLLLYSLESAPASAVMNGSTGAFSWTPSSEGSATFEVVVTDGELTDSQSVTVNVAANQPPVLNAIGTPVAAVLGDAVTFTATASDAEAETLTFGLTGAPAGATINPTTGAFSWTPSEGGSFPFSVTVSDANGSDSQSVTVNVSALSVSVVTLSRNRKGVVTAVVTITNGTSSTISNVRVTSATLAGTPSSSRLPLSITKNLRAGTSKTCKLQFSGVPAGSATLALNGTSSAGDFSSTQTVTVP